jgi:hypothetical protein
MFRWLDLQGNDPVIRVYDEAGNVVETHAIEMLSPSNKCGQFFIRTHNEH